MDAARDEFTTRAGGLPPVLVTNMNLLPGRYATITYQAVVDNPSIVTQVVNTAAITSAQQTAWIYASVTDRVEVADIGVGKGASDSVPDEGSTFAYTIIATNFGPFSASGIQLVDLLPGRPDPALQHRLRGLLHAGPTGSGTWARWRSATPPPSPSTSR